MKFGILRNNYLFILLIVVLPTVVPAQDYSYVTNNGVITITKYTGPGGDVIIPDTINGLPVTVIGNRFQTPEWSVWDVAFDNRDNLTSITIPDTVSDIGGGVLSGCTNFESVYFKGHAPIADKSDGDRIVESQFSGNNMATIYYLSENSGWGESYCGRPTALWNRPEQMGH